jgi:hypothetical protein
VDAFASGLCALFGACVQELGHWYEVRGRVSSVTYLKLMASKAYWVITSAMIICSAVGPVLWKANELANYTPFDFVIFGAAFPVLFKKAVAGIAENRPRRLGATRGDQPSLLWTYFVPGTRE